MSCKISLAGVVLPKDFIQGLTEFQPKFASAGIQWKNYHISKLAEDTPLPVVVKFPYNHRPNTRTVYFLRAKWKRGKKGPGERTRRATLDHWELAFQPQRKVEDQEPEVKFNLHFLIHGHEQIPGFKKGLAPELDKVLRFCGVERRGLIYFMSTEIEPEYQLFNATLETVWEGPVVVQLAGKETDVPGGTKVVAPDADEQTKVVYDKRRNRDNQVAFCRYTRRVVGESIRSYEYFSLYDLNGEVNPDDVRHILTNDGLIAVDDELETA